MNYGNTLGAQQVSPARDPGKLEALDSNLAGTVNQLGTALNRLRSNLDRLMGSVPEPVSKGGPEVGGGPVLSRLDLSAREIASIAVALNAQLDRLDNL